MVKWIVYSSLTRRRLAPAKFRCIIPAQPQYSDRFSDRMHPQQSPAEPPPKDGADQELTIILAEYGHQYARRQTALDGVNQTLTLYLAALGFVAPLAGAAAIFSQNATANPFVIAGLMAFAGAASVFALLRSYKARMEQTYAEKALSRLRRCFVDRFPDLRAYLPGPFTDDWPTPYSRRSRSVTFYGWTALCIAAGVFAGLAAWAVMWGLPYVYAAWFAAGVPALVGAAVFAAAFGWLWAQLNGERDAFAARFPSVTKVD